MMATVLCVLFVTAAPGVAQAPSKFLPPNVSLTVPRRGRSRFCLRQRSAPAGGGYADMAHAFQRICGMMPVRSRVMGSGAVANEEDRAAYR